MSINNVIEYFDPFDHESATALSLILISVGWILPVCLTADVGCSESEIKLRSAEKTHFIGDISEVSVSYSCRTIFLSF